MDPYAGVLETIGATFADDDDDPDLYVANDKHVGT